MGYRCFLETKDNPAIYTSRKVTAFSKWIEPFFFSVFYLTETFQNLNRDLNWQLAGDKHVTCIMKALKEEKKTQKPG